MLTRRELVPLLLAPIALRAAEAPSVLPGAQSLDWEGELDVRLMDGAHRFVERKIEESITARRKHWSRDFSSRLAYEQSVEPNRQRFRKYTGVVDERLPPHLEQFGDDDNPSLVAEIESFSIYQVRWDVLDGVHGEGLLLRPKGSTRAHVIALPDADQTPEQLAGLTSGIPPESQFARRLAESGFEVLVPTLASRDTAFSGHPEYRMTDQTHREWIYRQAFQMGRHIIGYEIQKTLAAVDWIKRHSGAAAKVGVAGYGEGGLITFYAAAADTRIDAALVSGYFTSRQAVWSEPIYRNVWALLEEFGDAEIATLIAPRGLVVEYSEFPRIENQKGDIVTPSAASVKSEFDRIASLVTSANFQPRKLITATNPVALGSNPALEAFAEMLDTKFAANSQPALTDRRKSFDPADRQRRQVRELETHVQALVRNSEHVRDKGFLFKLVPDLSDRTWTRRLRHENISPDAFIEGAKKYREYFSKEVIGRFDDPLLPPNARTRKIYDNEAFSGYDVVLDVYPDVIAWGILLVPKDIQAAEKRPVVVCQHGRQGVPSETVEGDTEYYHDFAARLARRGFVTFSPHNLYRGEDRYRWLDRKSNGVKASMFSFIVAQHDQILNWLGTLPFVDPLRIAFYGLSYGGETAVRVPTIVEKYALSICSGDFNNWTRKIAATDQPFSFMYTIEWEMPYFDMGSTFDYAEMTYLMIPRPFMVERGHHDRVGRDRWVAHEYAKVRWLYTQFGLADKTEIEYFNGGHTINAEGTFDFLHKHLNWPKR